MSAIHTKSLTGITSITTPPGVDNVFTVHSNDTTERFRVDLNGNQSIAGILTVSQDLDVDGHTNLDNVSISGVTTATGAVTLSDDLNIAYNKRIKLNNARTEIFDDNNLRIDTNGSIIIRKKTGYELMASLYPDAGVWLYYNNAKKFETSEKGIQVGTGVTIETNGQATYTGIVTASSFKLSDGSNVGGIESDSMLNTVGGTLSGDNIVIGGNSSSSGTSNTLYGYQSGRFIEQGDGNTCLGSSAGRNVDNDNYNTLIGGQAGRNMSSSNNTCVGYQASYMNNAQGNTVAFGYEAAKNATNSGRLTAIGYQAGKAHTGGNGNTYLGYQAGHLNGNGDRNVVIGDLTVSGSSDYNRVTVIGAAAGGGFGSNANDNTVVGYNAGGSTLTGTNNIIIGSGANLSGNVSNEITLGNSSITKFRIPGINVTLKDNGGTPTQGHVLTVDGNGEASFSDQSFNDNNIVNDISALALKVSALENSAASSTNSTYVDTFQDSNGIASFTNTTRNTSGEFISSISPKSFYKPNQAYFTYTLSSTGTAQNGACTFAAWMKSANGSNWTYNGSQGGGIMAFESAVTSSKYLTYNIGYGSNNGKFGAHTPGVSDCNTTNAWSAPANKWVLGVVRTGYNWSTGHVEIMHRAYDAGNFTTDADSNGGTDNYGVKASGIGRLFRHASNGYTGDYDNTYIAHMGFWNVSLNGSQLQALFNGGEPFDWTQNNGNYNVASNLQEYFKMDEGSGTTLINSANGGNATLQSGSGSWDTDTQQIGSANATGNFISNTITASSSTNKMGVVITYTDTTGTATLNTDLKVSLSANNGSNYTLVTLVAQPNFATGVKMALANDVTVTAGTQLKYKVEFANQASGSKVTRVTGISLQY